MPNDITRFSHLTSLAKKKFVWKKHAPQKNELDILAEAVSEIASSILISAKNDG